MSRYIYAGPYDMIEIEGIQVNRNSAIDIVDDAYVNDLTARGYHIFVLVDPNAVQTEVATAPVVEPPVEAPPVEEAPAG